MDRLSPEIIYMILEYLEGHHFRTIEIPRQHSNVEEPVVALYAPLAVISRTWQYVVERESFRTIEIQGTPDGIAQFAAVYSKPWRQAALKVLNMQIPYSCCCNVRDVDPACRHKRDAYVGAMTALYRCMRAWEAGRTGLGRAQIGIHFYVGMSRTESPDRVVAFAEKNIALWEGAEAASWISQLSTCDTIDVFAGCQLSGLFSNLQSLHLTFPSYFECGGLPIYGERHLTDLHKALSSALLDARYGLPHLQTLVIRLGLQEDEGPPSPGVDLRNEDGVDELCEAIRLLSQTAPLRQLTLDRVLISPDLFQDCRLPAGEHDMTTWPVLKSLRILFPAVAPNGEWYLKDDPGIYQGLDNTNHDQMQLDGPDLWHPAIEPTTFNPLQEAFARAVLRMPALRYASLDLQCQSHVNLDVSAIDRPRGSAGRISILEDGSYRAKVFGAWRDAMDADELAALEAGPIEDRGAAFEQKMKELEALMVTDRAIEIEAGFGGRRNYVREAISRTRPWNLETMFRKPAIWQPTPDIARLWMKWAGGGR